MKSIQREIDKYMTCILRCGTPVKDYEYRMRTFQQFTPDYYGSVEWYFATHAEVDGQINLVRTLSNFQLIQDTNV